MYVTIFGLGPIGIEYSEIFRELGYSINAVGRSAEGCRRFEAETGITALIGSEVALTDWPDKALAVVAVGEAQLGKVAKDLIKAGFARILVEKPGAASYDELEEVAKLATEYGADVRVAYNRRFYDSVIMGQKIIADDGGARSMHFDFTEWSHRIEPLEKEGGVKKRWFFHNSTHVVDLAFYLAGWPVEISALAVEPISWHPYSRFAGSGRTTSNAVFSYNADWKGPGRWQVELTTSKNRLIYRPLEELHIQPLGGVAIHKVELNQSGSEKSKPGFHNQVIAFLEARDTLPTIGEQLQHLAIYRQICPEN